MSTDEELTVVVRRHWNDWRQATYRLKDIARPHWDSVSGGVRSSTPRPFIHGYVMCDGMLSGELAHSCEHGPPPHQVKVCVTKVDNTKAVFALLKADADADLERAKARRAQEEEQRQRVAAYRARHS